MTTAGMDLTFRPLDRDDKDAWLELWRAYHEHYGETVSANLTFNTFDRLADRTNALRCRLAVTSERRIVGFINYFVHESTWTTREVCYIEDLFVAQDVRRQGVGRQLLDDVARVAGINRWARLYMAVPATDEQAVAFFRTACTETDWMIFEHPL